MSPIDPIHIRTARRADWEAVRRLATLVFSQVDPKAIDYQIRSHYHLTRVAEGAGGQLLGYWLVDTGHAPGDARRLWLEQIAVDPAAQGRGVGSQLLRDLTDWARDRGYWRLELAVAASNLRAQNVYRKSGWIRVPRSGEGFTFRKEIESVDRSRPLIPIRRRFIVIRLLDRLLYGFRTRAAGK